MSESVALAFLNIVLKVAPQVVAFIEGLIGDGGTITPDHVPQIFSHMADISKAAADLPSADANIANPIDDIKPVASEPHAP